MKNQKLTKVQKIDAIMKKNPNKDRPTLMMLSSEHVDQIYRACGK